MKIEIGNQLFMLILNDNNRVQKYSKKRYKSSLLKSIYKIMISNIKKKCNFAI